MDKNVRKINWKNIAVFTAIGLFIMAIGFGLWYWVYIWLPGQESRAMKAYFETIEKRYLLQLQKKAKIAK